jgi:hypothetical protein
MSVLENEEKYLIKILNVYKKDLDDYKKREQSKKCTMQRKLEPLFVHSLEFFKIDANP